MGWTKLYAGSREGREEITLTKSKYVSFSPSFVRNKNLTKNNYVAIYIDEGKEKTKIGFHFLKERGDVEGVLKLVKNSSTQGFTCSGSSLYTRLRINSNEMEKSMHFTPKEETSEGSKLFVIEIPKK